jgi:hypothetical protein
MLAEVLVHKGRRRCNPVLGANAPTQLSGALAHGCVSGGQVQRCGQTRAGEGFLRDRGWPNPEVRQAPAPERLIAKEGYDHSRDARLQPSRHRARATILDERRHTWKQPVVGCAAG